MKHKVLAVFIILIITLMGCYKYGGTEGNINVTSKGAFKYKGTWVAESYYDFSDEELEEKGSQDLTGKKVQIDNNAIDIFDSITSNVRYKLKVVDKSYVISYENNITAERFIDDRSSLDIISAIDGNIILCEFIILDDNNIVMIYKSTLVYLRKINDSVTFNLVDSNIKNEVKNEEGSTEEDVGVMIGIKRPRVLKEDGTYTNEEYRTIWISYKNGIIDSIYEKEDIIFPRMNGIWTIKSKFTDIGEKHIDYFEVANLEGKSAGNSEYSKDTSVYKSIKFIGNDYVAIESYKGDNFINEYPNYGIIPVDNINTDKGLSIKEIFNKDTERIYLNDFEKSYNDISDENKINYKDIVDYTSITMDRIDGKWILKGKISSIAENENGRDFKISTLPNKKLINFNSLLVPWKVLKGEVPFLSDAFTSPNGEIAIIRYQNYLSVYRIENGHLQGSPLVNIMLHKSDEIIMAEWCSSSYIDEWQKAFSDGRRIYIEEE